MQSTLKDVAETAGVSYSLVSRYLNGDQALKMRSGTRERIDNAIAALDYRPNRVAQSLRSGRTGTIGILVSNLRNRYYALLVDHVLEEANRRGYQLLIAYANDPEEESAALQMLVRRGVDGCLTSLRLTDRALLERLQKSGFPLLFFGRGVEGFPAVGRDRTPAILQGIEFLAARGHREICFITPGDEPLADEVIQLCRRHGIRKFRATAMPHTPEAPEALRDVCRRAPAAVMVVGWLNTNAFLRIIHREYPLYRPEVVGTYHFPYEYMLDERLVGFIYGDFSRFPGMLVTALLDRIEGRNSEKILFPDQFLTAPELRRQLDGDFNDRDFYLYT